VLPPTALTGCRYGSNPSLHCHDGVDLRRIESITTASCAYRQMCFIGVDSGIKSFMLLSTDDAIPHSLR